MKKTQVALAALALVASTAAMAGDVSIGGYMDAGVQKSTGNASVLTGGNLDINNIHFAASEEVDGIKAGAFALVRFESTTGALTRVSQGTTANFFEIAHVNIGSASLGTVELGRTVDSFWGNGVAGFDVTGGSNLGSAVSSVLNLQTSKVFVDNSVHYISPNISGLTVAATYVMQDSTTGSTIDYATKGDQSYTANFSLNGLRLGAGYMKGGTNTLAAQKGYFVGAGYDLGVANVNVIAQEAKDNSDVTIRNVGANAAIPLSGPLSATVGYYKDSGSGTFLTGSGSSYNAGLIYQLSKRTRLFANYQHATGSMTTNIGLSSPSGSGVTGTTMTAGIGHYF
jgi:hypothetical protein